MKLKSLSLFTICEILLTMTRYDQADEELITYNL